MIVILMENSIRRILIYQNDIKSDGKDYAIFIKTYPSGFAKEKCPKCGNVFMVNDSYLFVCGSICEKCETFVYNPLHKQYEKSDKCKFANDRFTLDNDLEDKHCPRLTPKKSLWDEDDDNNDD